MCHCRVSYKNTQQPGKRTQGCEVAGTFLKERDSPVVLPVFEHVEWFTEAKSRNRVGDEVVEPFGDVDGFSCVGFYARDKLVRMKGDCRVVGPKSFCCKCALPGDATAFIVRGSVALVVMRN